MKENKNKKFRYMGQVEKWYKDKKYGFIRCFDDGEWYFVHIRQINGEHELVRGAVVEFGIKTNQSTGKQYAYNVLMCCDAL